jgi:aminocarboxymuconate-semialdehyde decarboxylase
MFFTCSPSCTDPSHRHGPNKVATQSAAATKTATKSRAQVPVKPATQKTVRNSKGKLKVVDVHCHYLNPEVNKKTAHLNAAQ